jgi:hypothetical protein
MKKAREKNNEMLREYDFSKGVRGKYARRYARGSNVVLLERENLSECRSSKQFAAQPCGHHSPTQIASGKIEEGSAVPGGALNGAP